MNKNELIVEQARAYFNDHEIEKSSQLLKPLVERHYKPAIMLYSAVIFKADPQLSVQLLEMGGKQDDLDCLYKLALLGYLNPELNVDCISVLEKGVRLGDVACGIALSVLSERYGFRTESNNILNRLIHNPYVASVVKELESVNLSKTDGSEVVERLTLKQLIRSAPVVEKELINGDISLYRVSSFFSELECILLKARAKPQMSVSYIVDPVTGSKALDPIRTSSGCQFLPVIQDWVLLDAIKRISILTDTKVNQGEITGFLSYQKGEEYKRHYDFFDTKLASSHKELRNGGQRIMTTICYLNENYTGGETEFPVIGQKLKGKTGELIFFSNVDQDGKLNKKSLHRSIAIESGEKWVFNRWLRDSRTPFSGYLNSLGVYG